MDLLSALYGDDLLVESTPTTTLSINLRIEGITVGQVQAKLFDSSKLSLLDAASLQLRSVAGTRASDAIVRHRLVEEVLRRSSEGEDFSATICAIVELAQDLLQRAPCVSAETPPKAFGASTSLTRHCLLHIDHMRSRRSYTQLICVWATQLGLYGALLISGDAAPLILLYLRGSEESLREYKRLHRTTPVDVDSTGRKCKEKMMSELYDSEVPAATLIGFKSLEAASSAGADAGDSFVVAEGWPSSRTAEYLLQRGVPSGVLSGIPQLRDTAATATAAATTAATGGAVAGGAGASKL